MKKSILYESEGWEVVALPYDGRKIEYNRHGHSRSKGTFPFIHYSKIRHNRLLIVKKRDKKKQKSKNTNKK